MKLYDKLNSINVNAYTEEKQGLTYLKWSAAFRILEQHTESIEYKIIEDNGLPYWDTPLGLFVKTEMTVDGVTKGMTLPVLDHSNAPMYSTPGKVIRFKKEVDRPIASSFDINTATMRCFVKNIAMYGLGNYIYEGLKGPEATDITDAKIMSAEERELEEKKKLWSNFTNTLAKNSIEVDDFLTFWGIKKTQKVKLMEFTKKFNKKPNDLINEYLELSNSDDKK